MQEEIGLRGATTSAYGINPAVGIAVDVCHATDTPGNDKKQLGDTRAGQRPGDLSRPEHQPARLRPAARRLHAGTRSPPRSAASPRPTGTDANAIQITRDGVATGLIGIPNRYMHSPVEVVSLDDLDRAARLLAEFCLAVTRGHGLDAVN